MAIGDIGSHVKASKVTILNLQGLKLVGELDDTGSKDLCILCHGLQSSKLDPNLISVAKALTVARISSFRFDFTGNGESDGEFAYGSYWREADDIRSVVKYWRFRNWRILALIGHSKGGNAVVLYGAKYGDVGSLVNICGRFDLTKGFEARLGGKKGVQKLKEEGALDVFHRSGKLDFRVWVGDLEERLATDMHKACLEIPKHCRVMNIHGSADATVPVEDAHEFGKRIWNNNVHIIDGADHNFQLQQAEIAKLVVDFVRSSPMHLQLRSSL